jgi:hypothetical protein
MTKNNEKNEEIRKNTSGALQRRLHWKGTAGPNALIRPPKMVNTPEDCLFNVIEPVSVSGHL